MFTKALPGTKPGLPNTVVAACPIALHSETVASMPRQSPAKPSKQKPRKSAKPRRTTQEPTPDEVLYEIRDVVDEKLVKGKLLYKVDWADNPTTGERYDPTWVCLACLGPFNPAPC